MADTNNQINLEDACDLLRQQAEKYITDFAARWRQGRIEHPSEYPATLTHEQWEEQFAAFIEDDLL